MVDCVLTNEFIGFWSLSIIISLMLGYVYRGREVDRLNHRIENLNALIASLKSGLR